MDSLENYTKNYKKSQKENNNFKTISKFQKILGNILELCS